MSQARRGLLVILVALAQLGVTAIATAHPGHGGGENPYGLLHYLTEPVHVSLQAFLLIAAALGATWLGALPARLWERRRRIAARRRTR